MGYDKDTVSKDDFMGKISLSTSDITKLKQGQWIPLQGIKSGEIFIECDIITDVNVSAIVDDKEANNFARQPAGISGLSKDSETVGSVIHKSETLEEEAQSKNLEGMKKTDTIDSSMRKTEDVSAADVQTRTADGAENKASIPESISQHSEMKGKDILSTERTLKLTVISARKLKKSGLFGKADPYVALTYGSHKTKSSVVKNNLNPEWNFDNLLTINEKASDEVLLEVYDKDTGSKDDFMGRVSLPISELTTLKQGQWIPLQKTKSGEICLSCVFVSDLETSEASGDRDAFERVESVEELETATLTDLETKKAGGIRAVKELLSAEKKPKDELEHAESSPNEADTPQRVTSEPEGASSEVVVVEQVVEVENEAKLKEEGDAERAKLEEESSQKAEAEAAKAKQEEEARLKAEAEAAGEKLEEEARLKAEAEAAKAKLELEARLKSEAEAAKANEEEEARLKAEAEAADAKQEEEAKQKAEAEKAKQEEDERVKAEEAKQKAEAEAARAKQEEEIKQKAEAEKAKQEQETRLKAEEAKQNAEAVRAKQE